MKLEQNKLYRVNRENAAYLYWLFNRPNVFVEDSYGHLQKGSVTKKEIEGIRDYCLGKIYDYVFYINPDKPGGYFSAYRLSKLFFNIADGVCYLYDKDVSKELSDGEIITPIFSDCFYLSEDISEWLKEPYWDDKQGDRKETNK